MSDDEPPASAADRLVARGDLIQIEEPSASGHDEPDFAIGVALAEQGFEIAIAVGGNAEVIGGGAEGGALLSTAATAAQELLEHASDFQAALIGACRDIAARAQRVPGAAVVSVPADAPRHALAAVMGAVEGAGLMLLGLIETPVAAAYALELDQRRDGLYRFSVEDGREVVVEVAAGDVAIAETDGAADAGLVAEAAGPLPQHAAALGAALLAERRSLD